ncbi:MAG: DedA family protein [bacterium]|nr:DedA family protein [bacterium]
MVEAILTTLGNFIIHVIRATGYGGVVGLMAIESANIPLPSEVIMPFSGFLVSRGVMNLWLVGVAGAVGCVIGSSVSYWLGAWGGRPLVEKYGRFIFVSNRDLERADKWFSRYGEWAIFISRLLPVVRTFISLPAGISKMHFKRFIVYTFLGSLPWTLGLAYVGVVLGDNWDSIRSTFHGFDYIIIVAILLAIVWYVMKHFKKH